MSQARETGVLVASPSTKKTVIIGSGIAGLTAAIKVLSEKKKDVMHEVIIIEVLPEKLSAIRPQLIMLCPPTRKYFKTLQPSVLTKEDKQFLATFDDEREHVAIKDIQRYLKSRLAEQKNGKCTFLYDSKIKEMNVEKSTLTIETKDAIQKITTIDFNYLILAEGSKRSTAKILAENGYPIEFETFSTSHHKYMVSGYFLCKRSDGKPFELSSTTLEWVGAFYKRGIPHAGYLYYNRSSHIKSKQTAVKFYITVAIPLSFYEKFKESSSMGIQFLKSRAEEVIHNIFSEPDSEYEVTPVKPSKERDGVGAIKDKLKYQVFSRFFTKAKSASLMVGKTPVLNIGDSFKHPNFYLGNGGNNATSQGVNAGDFILGDITLKEFNHSSDLFVKQQIKFTEEFEKEFLSQIDDDVPLPLDLKPKEEKNLPKATLFEIKGYIENSITLINSHADSLQKEQERKLPKSTSFERLSEDIVMTRAYAGLFSKAKNSIPALVEAFQHLNLSLFSEKTEKFFKEIRDKTVEFAKRTDDTRKMRRYMKK